MSTVRFMNSLVGNMGAPLGVENSTWITGSAKEEEQREEAEVPLFAGLEEGSVERDSHSSDSE